MIYDISVVIPTKDREQQLFESVKSIVSQPGYTNCEVIVVNDGSVYSKRTLSKLRKFPRFTYFKIKSSGPAKARNIGSLKSRGELLAFIDDDCIADSSWLVSIKKYFIKQSQQSVFVGGSVKPLEIGASYINQYLCHIHHLDGPILTEGKITNMASANLIVRNVDFKKVKGFDERFPYAGAEDQNLVWKLSKIAKADFSTSLLVYHNHNISLSVFINKYRRYGRGVALHNYLAKDGATDSAVYNSYCHTYGDILTRFNRILTRAKQTRNRFESSANLAISAKIIYFFLSIIQETAFQIGSIDMRYDLISHPGKFRILTKKSI